MNEPTKGWGDVAGTTSLAAYLGRHAYHHPDVFHVVFGPDGEDGALRLVMEDGSEVTVRLESNYAERALGAAPGGPR